MSCTRRDVPQQCIHLQADFIANNKQGNRVTSTTRSAVVIGLNHVQLAMPNGQEQKSKDLC